MDEEFEALWIAPVIGSNKLNNWLWAIFLLAGSIGFLLAGLSSYANKDLLPVLSAQGIQFAPQGLVMCFYGVGGFSLSLYLSSMILWEVGNGYNEFDRREGVISLFRWGFPGKNRRIRIRFLLEDIQAVRLKVEEGWNSGRRLSVQMKDEQEIALMPLADSLNLREAEEQAAQLAKFLRVPMIT